MSTSFCAVPAFKRVEPAISALREAMKGEDAQRIRQALERMMKGASRLGGAAGRAGAGPGGDGDGGGGDAGPKVVDADFEEVDKRDRKSG